MRKFSKQKKKNNRNEKFNFYTFFMFIEEKEILREIFKISK